MAEINFTPTADESFCNIYRDSPGFIDRTINQLRPCVIFNEFAVGQIEIEDYDESEARVLQLGVMANPDNVRNSSTQLLNEAPIDLAVGEQLRLVSLLAEGNPIKTPASLRRSQTAYVEGGKLSHGAELNEPAISSIACNILAASITFLAEKPVGRIDAQRSPQATDEPSVLEQLVTAQRLRGQLHFVATTGLIAIHAVEADQVYANMQMVRDKRLSRLDISSFSV